MDSFVLEVSVVGKVHAEEEKCLRDGYCLDDEWNSVGSCFEAVENNVQDTV